jgi:hypothetical protein
MRDRPADHQPIALATVFRAPSGAVARAIRPRRRPHLVRLRPPGRPRRRRSAGISCILKLNLGNTNSLRAMKSNDPRHGAKREETRGSITDNWASTWIVSNWADGMVCVLDALRHKARQRALIPFDTWQLRQQEPDGPLRICVKLPRDPSGTIPQSLRGLSAQLLSSA